MLSEFTKLLSLVKVFPVLGRYIESVLKQTSIEKILNLIKIIGKGGSLKEAIENIKADDGLKNNLEIAIAKVEEEFVRSNAKDKAGARERDLAIRRLKSGKNFRANFMLLTALLGVFGCVIVLVMFKHALSAEMIAIISTVCGILGSCLKEAYSFEFGGGLSKKSLYFNRYALFYFSLFSLLAIFNAIVFYLIK